MPRIHEEIQSSEGLLAFDHVGVLRHWLVGRQRAEQSNPQHTLHQLKVLAFATRWTCRVCPLPLANGMTLPTISATGFLTVSIPKRRQTSANSSHSMVPVASQTEMNFMGLPSSCRWIRSSMIIPAMLTRLP